ncbi:ABC transporter substrate-binding protein [Phosphitispora sp. TUW77]|uniref:ABC transporter substrate-binding protein n=1 Tax=Phosphitispora sp. TUW77 TaxID=3152361 RepID=UPI003AB8FCDA
MKLFNNGLYKKNRALIISIMLSMVLVFTGCDKTTQTQQAEEVNSSANIAAYTIADATGDWGYPTPYGHYQRGPGYIRMSLIFDTLVWKDEKGFVPALAQKWNYSEGENSYLFELDEKAKWHDGQKLTSKDVAFTLEYLKKHPYTWVDHSRIAKVEVLDEYKVKIYLSEKYAPFLNNIAGVMPILPEHIWKNIDKPEEFRDSQALIGTGPYKLVDYNKEQGAYLYEANKDYYLGIPRVEKLRFVKVSNEMAAAALERGEVNFAQIPPELKDDLVQKGFKQIKTNYDWALKLMINHQKQPFSNKEFRQALAYAIDRGELVKTTKRGNALAGFPGLLSPDSEWYNPSVDNYDYNPDRAQELLKGLGYNMQNGCLTKNGQELSLELLFSPDFEREGQFIKQQLEKIGIGVKLKSLESKTVDSMLDGWKYDLAISGHGGLGGDAEVLNKMILGKSFMSARYTVDKDLSRLLKEQIITVDSGERKAKVEKIQELYAQNMPCVTLYYPDWYYSYDHKIGFFNTKNGIGFGIPLPFNKIAFIN